MSVSTINHVLVVSLIQTFFIIEKFSSLLNELFYKHCIDV